MTESVYQKASWALERMGTDYERCPSMCGVQDGDDRGDIEEAIEAGEKAEARVKELEAELGMAERERDEYLVAMTRLSDWIAEEREKHQARPRGGQTVGTTWNYPQVPHGALLALESIARPGDNRYTIDAVNEMATRLSVAEANYQWMVEHAADNKLDGYRELASKCAELEERAEKAERERDEARTALDAISVPDTIALLKQRAEKAEARLRETAQILMAEVGATGPQNVEEAAARIVARVRELEMIFRPEALGPVPKPGQSTDVAELDVPRESVTTPAEPGPASVAEQEPAAEVSADRSRETGEH